ncbi:U32 family peptidase [Desulfonatronospira sp. MSAO_Bac3]|uniref:peptidase U32 family protein n=1 Tax=Desulfonatronospira sp. MSAO_Bac3 TaxID=2293857 RepID=UPI000FF2E102|nr:U32 family peptidase [Desulfonatronospira sp. MSAO_Bac3]RQD74113.1 MAG: U32 family peptidase [Desulfonatronospira sp. MSAO_Bac3]
MKDPASLPELLCPAGDLKRLQTVLFYGADAVYLGGTHLNLRSKAAGFDFESLPQALDLARRSKARVYFCLNAILPQKYLQKVRKYLELLAEIKPDGIIAADPGVISMAREHAPHIPLHLSTQAGTYNAPSARFWKEHGVDRVNLARELSLTDIREMSRQTGLPQLEMFVHGAMCMALSGHCLLSAHLNKRSANQGLCTHPCRFDYRARALALEERTRPGEITWQVWEEEGYSRIFSSQDLCLVRFLGWLRRQGISSIKIEGRMKSVSYLGVTTDVYRTALDDLARGDFRPGLYLEELASVSSRPLGSGFFLPANKIFSKPALESGRKKILASVEKKLGGQRWLVQVKSRWSRDMDLELVLPGLERPGLRQGDYLLEGINQEELQTAHSGQQVVLTTAHELIKEHLLLRRA